MKVRVRSSNRVGLLVPFVSIAAIVAFAVPAAAGPPSDDMRLLFSSRTRAINSDLAFWGDLAFAGNYGGFRIFDISDPARPTLLSDFACFGPQNDVTVWDRDGDGEADILFTSIDAVLTGPECGSTTAADPPDPEAWEGIRIFDVSDPTGPVQIGDVYQDCGSHTHTLVPDPAGDRVLLYNQSYSLRPGPTCGQPAEGEEPHHDRDPFHGVIQVVEVSWDPEDPLAEVTAEEIAEPEINYPGDSDNVFDPEHHALPGFDPLRACHDSAVLLGISIEGVSEEGDWGVAAGACAEQAQLWRIGSDGLPVTDDPIFVFDNPADTDGVGGTDTAADFWHSATFTWDGQVVNFSDESFGIGCPPVTDISDPDADDAVGPSDTGRTYFLDLDGTELSQFMIPRSETRMIRGAETAYCSTHQGNVIATEDGYFMAQAWYMGGADVVDFSDPGAPQEVAFFDLAAPGAQGSDNWSHYWYQGPGLDDVLVTYGQDGVHNPITGRGFEVFELLLDDVAVEPLDHLNPQTQTLLFE